MEGLRKLDSKWKYLKNELVQKLGEDVNLEQTDKTSVVIRALEVHILASDFEIFEISVEKKKQQLLIQLAEENQREDKEIRPNEINRLNELLFHYSNFFTDIRTDFVNIIETAWKKDEHKCQPHCKAEMQDILNHLKNPRNLFM